MRIPTACLRALTPILLALLWGCVAGPLKPDNIQLVERGMSASSLSSMVGRKPTDVLTVVDPQDGLEYQVQIFQMLTGTTGTFIYVYQVGFISTTSAVTEVFAFLFRENSLVFWGFLHEYARAEEKLMRRLAPVIKGELEERRKRFLEERRKRFMEGEGTRSGDPE